MKQIIRSYVLFATLLLALQLATSTPFWYFPWSSYSRPQPYNQQSSSPTQQPSQSSNVSIAIGNRVNTNASTDLGTTISGLTINLVRWLGALWNDTAAVSNASFSEGSSRRKRSPQSGSFVSINGQTISLPASISNLTLTIAEQINDTRNATTSLEEQEAQLQSLVSALVNEARSLPLNILDGLVALFASQYQTLAKPAITAGVSSLESGVATVNNTANGVMDFISEQAATGIAFVLAAFENLSSRGQSCVGESPRVAANTITSKAMACVQDRWEKAISLAQEFASIIADTEQAYDGFLGDLQACNGANFNQSSATAPQDRRQCYIRASLGANSSDLLELPTRWASLGIQVAAEFSTFEQNVGACAANIGLQFVSLSARIGRNILLCSFY